LSGFAFGGRLGMMLPMEDAALCGNMSGRDPEIFFAFFAFFAVNLPA
jgi:hypothetical protein